MKMLMTKQGLTIFIFLDQSFRKLSSSPGLLEFPQVSNQIFFKRNT